MLFRSVIDHRKVLMKTTSLMEMEKPKYTTLRWDTNPYDGRPDVDCGPMFRTNIHKKIFEEVILALDTKIAPQKVIDFVHIQKFDQTFVNVFQTCQRLGLAEIMEFKNDYNKEVVMQFYATLFLEKDADRHFRWMTKDREYRVPLSKFAEALGIDMVDPTDTNFFRLHDDDFTRKPHELAECYDPSGTVMGVVHGHIGGLLPYYDTLHKLFWWTLFPKEGDSSYI